jgi:hypothetical protein
MKKILAALFALSLHSTAYSENYYSVSATKFALDGEDASLDYSAITGTYSSVMSDNMTGEFRLGIGIGDDSMVDFFGDTITSEIDNYFGVYLKFNSTSGQIKPYAIIGFTKFEVSLVDSSIGETESASEDDFSYGMGIDFENGLNLEYMQYLDKDGAEINGLSLGMKF